MSQQKGKRGIGKWDRWLDVSIEELDLPCPVIHRLSKAGILTVGQLASTTEWDLNRIYWFGKGSIERVNWALAQVGLPPLPKHIAQMRVKRSS